MQKTDIIFLGAGVSASAGFSVAAELRKYLAHHGFDISACDHHKPTPQTGPIVFSVFCLINLKCIDNWLNFYNK